MKLRHVLLITVACVFACSAAVAGDDEIRLLIRDLASPRLEMRADAERRLVLVGEPAVPQLVAAVQGNHPALAENPKRADFARGRAAKALGQIGGKDAVAALIAALDDSVALVRMSAMGALGDTKSPDAVEPLLALITDADASIASAAIMSLGSIGDKSTLDPIADILSDDETVNQRYKANEDRRLVRCAVAGALAKFDDTAAVPALLHALRNSEPRVRRHADLALRRLSGQNVGFDADASDEEREPAAKAWDGYWAAKGIQQ